MPVAPDREGGLREVLWALRAHLDDLVLIGGWVPYLHRRYGTIPGWRTDPIFTTELDFMLDPRDLGLAGGGLADALRAAGFRPSGHGPAAVWRREGEPQRLEFFIEHGRSGRELGSIRSLGAGLGALSLHGLQLLAEFTTRLDLPARNEREDVVTLGVTVPELGAFVIQKADSFPRRREGAEQAKDLFYLVEIAAAGDRVQEHLTREVEAVARATGSGAPPLIAARHNLGAVLRTEGSMRRLLDPVADMVAARYALEAGAARARTEGYLRDILDILRAQ